MAENENIPEVPLEQTTVIPGKQTSAYQMTKRADLMSWVGIILGAIIAIGPDVLQMAPENAKWSMILGTAIILASKAQSMLVKLGYIKYRENTITSPYTGKYLDSEKK